MVTHKMCHRERVKLHVNYQFVSVSIPLKRIHQM